MRYITLNNLTPKNYKEFSKVVYRRVYREEIQQILNISNNKVTANDDGSLSTLEGMFDEKYPHVLIAPLPRVFSGSDKVLLLSPHDNENITFDFWSISFNNGHCW